MSRVALHLFYLKKVAISAALPLEAARPASRFNNEARNTPAYSVNQKK